MSRIRGLRRFFRLDSGTANVDADVDDELRFHFDMAVAELVAAGASPDEARREAERRFGDVRGRREELISIDRGAARRRTIADRMDVIRQDVAYALRGMRRSPGFAIMITVTLALGLGANAAVFSLVDRLFLRAPGGVVDPSGVYRVYDTERYADGRTQSRAVFNYPEVQEMSAGVPDNVRLAAYSSTRLRVGPKETATSVRATIVGPGYFELLGVRPALGRFFSPDELNPDAPAAAIVLSDRMWRTQFGSDSSVLGRSVEISEQRVTVIGVAPAGFSGIDIDATDAWLPLGTYSLLGRGSNWQTSRGTLWLQVLLRPRAGAPVHEIMDRATVTYRAGRANADWGSSDQNPVLSTGPIIAARGPETGRQEHELSIATRLAAVALIVLLIACANVANLLLARGVQRRREIAVRLALGVSRARLVRQLLVETVILTLIAGSVAVIVAIWAGSALRHMLLPNISWAGGAVSGRILAFTAALAVIGAFVAGLAPALRASRPDVAQSLKAGAHERGNRRSGLRTGLLVVQTALSVVLLVGAGLFVRSLAEVTHLDIGFDANRLVMANGPSGARDRIPSIQRAMKDISARLANNPAVEDAALASVLPFRGISFNSLFIPGRDSLPEIRKNDPTYTSVSPEFFSTVGLRITQGRGISAEDRAGAPPVVVVNEVMAELLWPGQDPIGECLKIEAATNPCHNVIGVVENARRTQIIEDPAALYYLSLPQSAESAWVPSIVVRARQGASPEAATALRSELSAAFPGETSTIWSLSELLDPQLRPWRMGAVLFGILGLLALVVAAVGVYSMLAYSVGQRTHEMGVRMALGAQRGDVVRMILGEGARVTLVGVVVGIAGALLAGRFVSALLYNVSPRDPTVLAGVGAVLMLVGIAACMMPARRATRVDPLESLRAE